MSCACLRCGDFVDLAFTRVAVVGGEIRGFCGACSSLPSPPDDATAALVQAKSSQDDSVVAAQNDTVDCVCGRTLSLLSASYSVVDGRVEASCQHCGFRPRALVSEAGSQGQDHDAYYAAYTLRDGGLRGWLSSRVAKHAFEVAGFSVLACCVVVGLRNFEVPRTQAARVQPTVASVPIINDDAIDDDPRAWLARTSKPVAPVATLPTEQMAVQRLSMPASAEPVTNAPVSAEPVQQMVELQVMPASDGSRWVHPIAGAIEMAPDKRSRRFGAKRPGNRPAECRLGHCGVDLFAAQGTPVLTVRDGVVERARRRTIHNRSGKYVMVRHPNGDATYYMHLDRIPRGLRVGVAVKAGQKIGTVGRTGLKRAAAHLHFGYSRRIRPHYDKYHDPRQALLDADVREMIRPADDDHATAAAADTDPRRSP